LKNVNRHDSHDSSMQSMECDNEDGLLSTHVITSYI